MNEDSLVVLNELSKGCSMGIESLETIMEKIEDDKFKEVIFSLMERYNKLSNKISKLYEDIEDEEAKDASTMTKVMSWSGIQMKTMTDNSVSKLSELTMQGLNMGIIEGRKLLNNTSVDTKVEKLLNDYVGMQEEYVEKLKEFL